MVQRLHRGRQWISRRSHDVLTGSHAAGDLQVQQLIVRLVGIDELAGDGQPFVRGERVRDADLAQAARETGHVLMEPENAPVVHRQHLVDAIAEQEPSVENGHLRITQGPIPAVQIAQAVRNCVHGVSSAS